MSARAIHLVGSVPLADAGAVFTAVATEFGGRLRRIPDGETGERSEWTAWQRHVFDANPLLEPAGPPPEGDPARGQFRLRPGARSEDVRFGNLGYADVAVASYEQFAALQSAGTIAPDVRFQVSMPTPIAVLSRFIVPSECAVLEPAYERAMLDEVRRMAEAIPAQELALQWDVAGELAFWERANGHRGFRYLDFEPWFDDVKAGILERLTRLCNGVPRAVELGVHLCYGNRGGHHFIEPADTATAVEIANALFERVNRPITFLHLPVPVDRDDDAYFAPLRRLRLPAETELYLGLVHEHDGVAGANRRIAAASTAVTNFGIGTECGFGRRPPESIPHLFALHRDIVI